MKQIADKLTFNSAFASGRPIEVDAPELGEGVVVRFKPELTVNDLVFVSEVSTQFKSAAAFTLALVRRGLVDADGNAVVDDNADAWFMDGANATLMLKLAKRADLVKRYMAHNMDDDGDSDDLTPDAMRRVVATVAVALKVTPAEVGAMSAGELTGVLKALNPKAA